MADDVSTSACVYSSFAQKVWARDGVIAGVSGEKASGLGWAVEYEG